MATAPSSCTLSSSPSPSGRMILAALIVVVLVGLGAGQRVTYIEQQLNCALEVGPCDHLGQQVKEFLPAVIRDNCRTCSSQQAATVRRLTRFIQVQYPEAWRQLVVKYSDYGSTVADQPRK